MVEEIEYSMNRKNRTWVVLIHGTTLEDDQAIHHNSRMIKFDMPIDVKGKGQRTLKNNKEDVINFYTNVLMDDETIKADRLINAGDLNSEIVSLIPYHERFFRNEYLPASIDTYIKKKIYGHQ